MRAVSQSYAPYYSALLDAFDPCYGARQDISLCGPKLVDVIAKGQALLDRLVALNAPPPIASAAESFAIAVRSDVAANQRLAVLVDHKDAAGFKSSGVTVGSTVDGFCGPLSTMQAAVPGVALPRNFCY